MTRFAPLPLQLVKPEWADTVPSPAHDALNARSRQDYLAEHPFSYLRVTRAPEDVALARSQGEAVNDNALTAGRRALHELLEAGVFGPERSPQYYVYRLTRDGRSMTGIVGGIAIDDYRHNELRIHERIRPERSEHLAAHLEVVGRQSSPIAAAYRPSTEIEQVLAEVTSADPLLSAQSSLLLQEVWPVLTEDGTRTIQEALAQRTTYVIDGHHRAAAADIHQARQPAPGPADWLLAALFPVDQLQNRAFHRVVPNLSLDRLATAVTASGGRAELRELGTPPATGDGVATAGLDPDELAVFGSRDGGQRWMALRLPMQPGNKPGNIVQNLDPVRLDYQLLGPVLGLDAVSDANAIKYRPGSTPLATLTAEAAEDSGVLFMARPVPVDAILEAADAALALPPKSTYFEPKIRSGVFLRDVVVDPDETP